VKRASDALITYTNLVACRSVGDLRLIIERYPQLPTCLCCVDRYQLALLSYNAFVPLRSEECNRWLRKKVPMALLTRYLSVLRNVIVGHEQKGTNRSIN
jgi:hypothetical protein